MIPPRTPRLALDRLLLVATGSVAAADLPFWSTWLRTEYPDLEVKVALTPSATRFVTPTALAGRLRGEVLLDEWPQDTTEATHVELWQWAEGVLVHPCTLDYLGRLAQGLAGTPSLLALQCTSVPVVLAPGLPPGGAESRAYQEHVERLGARPNVRVIPPQPGHSSSTGRMNGWAPQLFPECLAALEGLRRALEPQHDEELTA